MASSSLSKFIIGRKLNLLETYYSRNSKLLSAVVAYKGSIDDVNILGHFLDESSDTKKMVRKALKEYLSKTSLKGERFAVFLGDSDQGPVCELFAYSSTGKPDSVMSKQFSKEILCSVIHQAPPAHAILVDENGCSTFLLRSNSITNIQTVLFQNDRAEGKKKEVQKAVKFLNDALKSKVIFVGFHKNMSFIKEEEALKGYTKVVSQRIIEANRMELDSALIASCQHWSEFDIVLEMKILRELFSEPEEKISSGVDDSLVALQLHELSVLMVHSSLEAYVSIPLDEENGFVTRAIDQGDDLQQNQLVDLFEWLECNQRRFKCKIVIVCSDLPQGHQLQAAGGMAGIRK